MQTKNLPLDPRLSRMVVEADEFDRALLWLKPDIAIVSTVSFDHPDVFADQADYDRAFIDFARGVRPGGTYVVSADDPGCKRVTEAVCAMDDFAGTIVTFGEQEGAEAAGNQRAGRETRA